MGQSQTQTTSNHSVGDDSIHKYLELWCTVSCGSLSFSVFGDWGLGYVQIFYSIKEAMEAVVFEAIKPATSCRDTGEVWLPLEVFSLSIRESKNVQIEAQGQFINFKEQPSEQASCKSQQLRRGGWRREGEAMLFELLTWRSATWWGGELQERSRNSKYQKTYA